MTALVAAWPAVRAGGQSPYASKIRTQAAATSADRLLVPSDANAPPTDIPNFELQTNGVGTPSCDCTSNTDCRDLIPPALTLDNQCTANVCQLGCYCTFLPLYDPTTYCCNPKFGPSGGLTLLDDGNGCTADVCDPVTGLVTHVPLTDTICDDGQACTWGDVCQLGTCMGHELGGANCASDSDCPAGTCDLSTGQCACHAVTPLCLELLGKTCTHSGVVCYDDVDCGPAGGVCSGEHADPQCLDGGQTYVMAARIGAGNTEITSGQFLIQYDNTCIESVSVGPCPGDTLFTQVVHSEINRVAGEIFYAVQSSSAQVPPRGTAGPYNVACVSFRKRSSCSECSLCLTNDNWRQTLLADRYGTEAAIESCGCSDPIRTTGNLTLSAPVHQSVHVDCGESFATVNWAAPVATDSCQDLTGFICKGHHESGMLLPTATVYGGGQLPPGNSDFLCTATNTCGATVERSWTVSVSPKQAVEVQLQLQPLMNNGGVFQRAVTFDLYNDCASEPISTCAELSFQGPYNFPGHARAIINVDYGNILCITAQDRLHTLRSIVALDDLSCINKKWQVAYKGDPLLGGNWLISGNLDGHRPGTGYGDRNTINILDFGTFIAELAHGSSYGPQGDTACDTPGPHADFNADGVVDSLDYTFIINNFLANSEGLCCSPQLSNALVEANPITAMSIKDLRKSGFGDLVVADLNQDGMLDIKDMNAFMQGAMPPYPVEPVRHGKGRSR